MIDSMDFASLRFGLLTTILAIFASACHGESDPQATGGAGAPTTQVGGSNNVGIVGGTSGRGGTSSTGGTSASSTAGGTVATPGKTGQVMVMNLHQASVTRGLSVMFRDISPATSACDAPESFGDCTYYPNCDSGSITTNASAGAVTMTSTQPAMTVTILPGTDNQYVTGSGALDPGFSGGETAHISAAGATVPAFATDIAIPLVLLIDSPAPDANGLITANATNDLVLKFSRGAPGVDLLLQTSTGMGTLTCQAASTTGTMTIRTGALAIIGSLRAPLYTFGNKIVTAGAWSVTVGSLMEAFTPDKARPVTITVN
jgi:hypothetical protein